MNFTLHIHTLQPSGFLYIYTKYICVCACVCMRSQTQTCACICARMLMWVYLNVNRVSGCSFSLCQCNVYISRKASINFLHVETRSYDWICMLMYVYMYNCGDAVLSGWAVTAHLYKWLFWSGILIPCRPEHPHNHVPHKHKHTHILPDMM